MWRPTRLLLHFIVTSHIRRAPWPSFRKADLFSKAVKHMLTGYLNSVGSKQMLKVFLAYGEVQGPENTVDLTALGHFFCIL